VANRARSTASAPAVTYRRHGPRAITRALIASMTAWIGPVSEGYRAGVGSFFQGKKN